MANELDLPLVMLLEFRERHPIPHCSLCRAQLRISRFGALELYEDS